jgi:DNA polymerase-1
VSKLLLLDGNSLTYRAFFALPPDMATASGQVTNAVFGFTSMLINLLRDNRPDGVIAAFDRPEPTFRHEVVADYKANRTAAPDILRQQMGLVRQVVETLGIVTLDVAGFEADDIIATVVDQAKTEACEVVIVTGDRDEYQLVEDPLVKVLYNRRGVSDYALYDEAGILERTGVTPKQYPEYAALRGDPSDNLAGVPGVGEKTAAKLISTYGGLDGVFANLDSLTPKLRASLAEHEPRVRQNAAVMVLRRDAPVAPDLGELSWGPSDMGELKRLFDFLEFRTLFERLEEVLDARIAAPVVAGGEVLEAEVVRYDSAPAAAVALAQPLRPHRPGRRARPGDSVGRLGPRRLSRGPRRAVGIDRRPPRPRPPGQGAHARPRRAGRRPALVTARHGHRRLPDRPGREPLRLARPPRALHGRLATG